jgi:hypothetical protein
MVSARTEDFEKDAGLGDGHRAFAILEPIILSAMDRQFIVPYLASQAIALSFVGIVWRWPTIARLIAGVGFFSAGVFNLRAAIKSPQIYVDGFGPHALGIYKSFIYGTFQRHTLAFVAVIACGQILIGLLAFAPVRRRALSYIGAIIFLVAITPLGMGAAVPSTLIFAVAFGRLLYLDRSSSEEFKAEQKTADRVAS